MKVFHRFLYLIYYLKESSLKKLKKFLDYSSTQTGKSRLLIMIDAAYSVFKYNVSLNDYFYFNFFQLSADKRNLWAGTGFMYEYQLKMNPKGARDILSDKIKFLKYYQPFIKRKFIDISSLDTNTDILNQFLSAKSGKIVLKGSKGQIGAEVRIVNCADHTSESLLKFMQHNKLDLIEDYIVQHPDLMELSPSGLNTVRIFTQLNKEKVDVLGVRLRISVNSQVDNMAAGNLAAPVDPESGIVNGPAVYSDITRSDQTIHPITGIPITGFKIPFWKETLQMAIDAALFDTSNRSIGWDIAITANGPELIEGNHNWCKLLWQLPVKQGLKKELLKYM